MDRESVQYWDPVLHISFLGCATPQKDQGCLTVRGFCGLCTHEGPQAWRRCLVSLVSLSCFHVPDTDKRSCQTWGTPSFPQLFSYLPFLSHHALPAISYQTSPMVLMQKAKLTLRMDRPASPWSFISVTGDLECMFSLKWCCKWWLDNY